MEGVTVDELAGRSQKRSERRVPKPRAPAVLVDPCSYTLEQAINAFYRQNMMTTMMKRRAPEVRATLVAEDDELIAELNSLTDACLRGARMERDAGLRIGELLTKKRGDPKKRWGFNEWVAKNCRFSVRMAQKYMAASANTKLLRVSFDDWSLDELAQGKKYEPPVEPTIDIKVATTEHPIVRVDSPPPPAPAPVKPQRPPCPGVEGTNNKEWMWVESMNKWIQTIHYEPQKDQPSAPQGVRLTKSARDWVVDYVKFCTEDKITSIMEAIRRLEHPDRGGSNEITVVLNQYLTERKQHES